MKSIIRMVLFHLIVTAAGIYARLSDETARRVLAGLPGSSHAQPGSLRDGQLSGLLICRTGSEQNTLLFNPALEIQIPYTEDDAEAVQSVPPCGNIVALNGRSLREFYSYEVKDNNGRGTITLRLHHLPRLARPDVRGTSSIIMMGHMTAPEVVPAK